MPISDIDYAIYCLNADKSATDDKLRIKAYDTATEALREKQEREAPCEYCGDTLNPQWRGEKFYRDIERYRYCPMCGRPLKGEDI